MPEKKYLHINLISLRSQAKSSDLTGTVSGHLNLLCSKTE